MSMIPNRTDVFMFLIDHLLSVQLQLPSSGFGKYVILFNSVPLSHREPFFLKSQSNGWLPHLLKRQVGGTLFRDRLAWFHQEVVQS